MPTMMTNSSMSSEKGHKLIRKDLSVKTKSITHLLEGTILLKLVKIAHYEHDEPSLKTKNIG